MRTPGLLAALIVGASGPTAVAQQGPTVQSLLKQEYRLVGATVATGGGAAIFLQKGDQLMFCYVTETRDSREVTTQYCKPVQ